jgi:hypothetical protein
MHSPLLYLARANGQNNMHAYRERQRHIIASLPTSSNGKEKPYA